MRGVVLGVLAAAVFVVILDQVLEKRGVEVVLLGEDALEAEIHQGVDDGTAKIVAFGLIGDVFTQPVKESDFGPAIGFDGKDIVVGDGDVAQGIVEELGELWSVLIPEQMGDEMVRFQAGGIGAHLELQHLQFIGSEQGQGLFPAFATGEAGVDSFGFKGEFVVQKFIEKNLGDDLELVAIVTEAIGGTDTLEVVDQLPGSFFEILCYHALAPFLLPEINSFMYSVTTSRLMVREASGLSFILRRV